jgi:sporulation protein YlmC with PRC-barrel domain
MTTQTTGTGYDNGSSHSQVEHIHETHDLISAEKVTGTSVYNAQGDKIGTIHDLMLDKRGGRVAYAVMSFGGFLGIGEKYHPLPWHVLSYDENQGGYNIGLTDEQLRNAPSYSQNQLSSFGTDEDDELVGRYYGGLGYPPLV